MIKGNITFIICILLLQITLPLIIQAQESKTNKLAQEPISRYLQLPPHLTFVLSCIEKENDSSSLRGRVGFQFSGNSLPSESFFIGWRNAMLFEKSTKDVYGFYSGVYGNVEEMYGIQISTLNESLKMEGVQIAIFANLSNAGNGVQISAIMNSASNWNGIQLSLGGNQILSRYYERRKSLRVKSHERSFSKNDEDDCRNPNGALGMETSRRSRKKKKPKHNAPTSSVCCLDIP